MSLPLPRNAASIVGLREGGLRPEDPVVVSFVGDTGFANPHVFADSGKRYDWRFLKGLTAQIFVRPGVDAQHAICAIFDEVDLRDSYPALVDIEREQVAFIVGNHPLQTWPVMAGTELWKGFFS